MQNRKHQSRKLIALASLAVVLLTALATCGGSYAYATRTAANFETRIASARSEVAADNKALRDQLATVGNRESLAEGEALRLFELALQHPGPRGYRIVALELTEKNIDQSNVGEEMYARIETILKAHRRQASSHRTTVIHLQEEYTSQLRSAWLGRWMRLAGYPHKPPKKSDSTKPSVSRASRG